MSRPKIRKVNTTKRKKKRKDSQKQLAEQAAIMVGHPKECSVCKKPFERTHETVKEWMVVVRGETQTARLACPGCWTHVNKVLEERTNDEN